MSRHNLRTSRPRPTSPVRSETTPTAVNASGIAGYRRDGRSELYLLAVSLIDRGKYHESTEAREQRLITLGSVLWIMRVG
jgi:hypothetical protein